MKHNIDSLAGALSGGSLYLFLSGEYLKSVAVGVTVWLLCNAIKKGSTLILKQILKHKKW